MQSIRKKLSNPSHNSLGVREWKKIYLGKNGYIISDKIGYNTRKLLETKRTFSNKNPLRKKLKYMHIITESQNTKVKADGILREKYTNQ